LNYAARSFRLHYDRENLTLSFCAIAATALLLAATAVAIYRPLLEWDMWWYHLPFSARLWNIAGGAESFHLSPLLAKRWEGFPLTWEWVQGLCWAATGSLRATIIPQLLLCFLYFFYVRGVLKIPASWLILGFFSCPMLFIHFEATYFDLPAAVCLAIGFFALFAIIRDLPHNAFSWTNACISVASLGLAGNIKYQGLISCIIISGIAAIFAVLGKNISLRRRGGFLALILAVNLVAGISATSNLVKFGNPFYPVEVKIGKTAAFPGPESDSLGSPNPTYKIHDKLISLPWPSNFVLSISELDWTLRGVFPWYNIDSSTGDNAPGPQRGGRARTGGWGSLFVAVNIFLLALQLAKPAAREDADQHRFVIACLLLIVATSLIPRAHELRYWLCIPLIILPINLKYLRDRLSVSIASAALGAMTLYGMAQALLSLNSDLLRGSGDVAADPPAAVTAALESTGRYCNADDDLIFRYSRAITGRPGLISGDPKDCEGNP
jgi:hypothetical protein